MEKLDLILVEDSDIDGQLLERIIKKETLTEHHLWMKDGNEILEYFKDETAVLPIAILLDIKLPKVNGLEVLKKIKSSDKTKNIPVVMYSSSYREEDIKEAYEYGANSYLVKPTGLSNMKTQFVNFFNYWIKFNHSPLQNKN